MSLSSSLPFASLMANASPKVVEVGRKAKSPVRPQVLILANPTAGARGKTTARRRQLERVRDELEKSGFAVHLGFEHESKGIRERARNAALAETDIIVAAGGDGTVNAVANGMLEAHDGKRPFSKLAVLPMGTGNVFALNMRIPSDIKAACRVIIEGHVRRIDVGSARPLETARPPALKKGVLAHPHDLEHAPSPRYFLLMAGVGFDAKVIEDTSLRLKMMLRDFAYALRSLQNAVVHQGTEVTLSFDDGTVHSSNSWLLMAGNAASYAWAIRFTEHARLDDGKLDLCVFPFENKLTSVQQVMQLLMGQHIERGSASYFQTTGVRIESTPLSPYNSTATSGALLRSNSKCSRLLLTFCPLRQSKSRAILYLASTFLSNST